MRRKSGILLPIFSLPSKYGIGTIGKEAYNFIDFLKRSGQEYWQILPVGPTSYGDSPYSSFSTFAGNPYFIDLDMLKSDGLLTQEDIDSFDYGADERYIDYGKLYENRLSVLEIAAEKGYKKYARQIGAFKLKNELWLSEYALFMACKKHFGDVSWIEWPDEKLRKHDARACAKYRKLLREEVRFYEFVQFLFFKQWGALKNYSDKNGIKIIGDIPIYVALDSVDVWSEPHWFCLDEENLPIEVAGVPPDYFSEDGQLWGNPLYDWRKLEEDGYGWWIRRIDGVKRLYDVLRIDHFRGFESYWAVPYGEETAKDGRWKKGPGMKLVGIFRTWFADLSFIAEDLGLMTSEVIKLLRESKFPGMKVLEFSFDPNEPGTLEPHNYVKKTVCYTGTHDNNPIMGWLDNCDEDTLEYCSKYLGLSEDEGFNWGMIRAGMGSVCQLFVAQMQDYLGYGAESRINIPGVPLGNWRWRTIKSDFSDELAEKIDDMTVMFGRA